MRNDFRKHYKNFIEDDFEEDFALFNTLKRTVKSYLKSPTVEKLHTIYNRIYLLKRLFCEVFIYDQLINHMDTYGEKQFIKYFIHEAFDYAHPNLVLDDADELWKIQLADLLENTKIKTSSH